MVGFIAKHPAITTFVAGSAALATANAIAPDDDTVGALNTLAFGMGGVMLLLGATSSYTRFDRLNYAIGAALMGAGAIGTGMHAQLGASSSN